MFTLEAARRSFFDREAVAKKMDAATGRVLSKFGAFVRTRSRTSVRKRRGTSEPGSPPFSHKGDLRRGILFGYDAGRQSVVVGPVLLGSQSGAPRNLERGGNAVVRGRAGARRAFVRPRPFMAPALEAERRLQMPQMLRDMLHK